MKLAKDFIDNGEGDGRWETICHPKAHPFVDNHIYDGNRVILDHAIRIAYLEGMVDGHPEFSGNTHLDQALLKELDSYRNSK